MTICVVCACNPHNAHQIRGGSEVIEQEMGSELILLALSGGILNPDNHRGILSKKKHKSVWGQYSLTCALVIVL